VDTAVISERAEHVRFGRRLEYFTIAWNSLEGILAVGLGLLSGSVALTGFGLDSAIEVTSGVALLWRLGQDNSLRREHVEAISLKIVGWSFVGLALYVLYDSLVSLIARQPPERSTPGIVLATASLVVMPLLARQKRSVAGKISSAALKADAKQAEFCMYLSAVVLGGLVLNALLGWWWADPLAGLLMVPIIGREGFLALKGRTRCHC
jgi:divalent metal cation (Fe/Co/Zn/Cd) transporter